MNKRRKKVKVGSRKLRNWTAENIKGKRIDNRDPIKGIKFRKKEIIPKAGAKSFSKINKIIKVDIPVRKLVIVLSWM